MSGVGTAESAGSVPPRESHKGPFDRFLSLFADVRGGEAVSALLLMLNLFLVLAAYYLLKVIREPLILSGGGAEVKSYSAAAIAAILMVLVPIYSALASRVSRVKLINGVTLFFILCLVAFFAASQAGMAVGVPFFIWVGIFNLMVIAQVWAFVNDIYTVEEGKRLFAIVGVGASLGAIAGSFVTGQLVERFGPYPFMLAAAALLALCMLITNAVNVRERSGHGGAVTEGDRAESAGAPAASAAEAKSAGATGASAVEAKSSGAVKGRSGFALVFSDRYLLLIALLMLIYNTVNTTGEYILGKTVVNVYAATHGADAVGSMDEKAVIGSFYGNFFTIVNIVSALIQAFVVSRILKHFGVRAGLLVMPVVALLGYTAMAFLPMLAFIRSVKIAENSLDYSLQSTTKNALYLPTSREAKYKAKQANDTFFVRFGDLLSAGLVFAGTTWLALAPKQFAMLNAALVVIWLILAVAIGRRFQRLAGTA